MMRYFATRDENSSADKRLEQQAQRQGSSQKRIPTLEQTSEKPTDDENGAMLTTAEIIDFAEGADTYL